MGEWKLKVGDKIKLVKKNDFAGFKGHKVGDIATFRGWLKEDDEETPIRFKLRWEGEKTNAKNSDNDREWYFLLKRDNAIYWEFAYDKNSPKRQKEYLVRNI